MGLVGALPEHSFFSRWHGVYSGRAWRSGAQQSVATCGGLSPSWWSIPWEFLKSFTSLGLPERGFLILVAGRELDKLPVASCQHMLRQQRLRPRIRGRVEQS